MILYFANRKLNIIGKASTELPKGLTIVSDKKTEDVETGVAVFDCTIPFNDDTREMVENCASVGNYILRSYNGENEFYTIIDSETDTKRQEVYIYAEDAGLDLLNEIVGAYEADKAYSIAHYIQKFAYDSGFQIGVNEVASLTRKLSWDGEQTVTERIASIATQFDGAEVSYSFGVDGMNVVSKFINIYKGRGKDIGANLRLNKDIDRIITKKTIMNLATALKCTGGTPEDEDYEDDVDPVPVTLSGYAYDDGDFFVDGQYLKSREAQKKWDRFTLGNGYIVRPFSYDTLSQKELCTRAISELKKLREAEVNYEVDINKLPDNIRIGDRINIIDDAGQLYVSARVLKLETSAVEDKHDATLGEYLIKGSGISQKVADLAAQFAKAAASSARALSIASSAKTTATAAQAQANAAVTEAENAQNAAAEATAAANTATASAAAAQEAASNAQAAVDVVEENVAGLETTVANAQAAAEQAQQAAQTAETKATEAQQAATNAQTKANEAATAAGTAQSKADEAKTTATTAQTKAEQAVADAEEAATTAAAAKLDAENAQKDIDALGDNLATLENTMSADYARKTDLTEATASLQTQITQNAAEISSTASRVQTIDETANNAATQAAQAQTAAQAAQTQADQATADAQAAQTAADNAAAAASSAQSEADKAKTAAATAKSVADKAQEDLEAAQADLATVTSRVGATEEEIAAAQQAVTAAQTAADTAKADAASAAQKATAAQTTADTAVTNAATAKQAADDAADLATIAQAAADAAKGDAAAAQTTADQAKAAATAAQSTADTAKTNAANAQAKADQAAADAATAQQAANNADAKAVQAAADLATAQQNLADVTSRVDATEEEVAAAQAAVETAQAAADKAKADAATAQSTANTAKANAATAQTAANNAKTAADNAQAAADDAQDAADAAQAAVDALAVRVTTAETKITQNSEAIELRATKTEVAQTLGNYYTKTETNAAITTKASEITSTVEKTYQKTVSKGEQLVANGNGLMGDNTNFSQWTFDGAIANNSAGSFTKPAGSAATYATDEYFPVNPTNEYTFSLDAKSSKGVGRLYSMLMFYDADKREISAGTHLHNAASTTTLAKDLKAGDTVVYLTSTNGWSTSYAYGFYLTVWNYKNSFGYTYPAGTYSRTRLTLTKSGNYLTNLNTSAKTVTLASAYSGATIPAGTAVSQGGDGATYKYFPCSNTKIPTSWTSYSGKITGVDNSGQNKSNTFPPGTAYAKVGFLWNYQGSGNGEQLWVTNISVSDTTAASAAQNTANAAQTAANNAQTDVDQLGANLTAAETRITQTENSISSQATQISSLGTRMSTVEQTASGLTVSLQTTNDNVATAQSTADTAKNIANAGTKKINTHLRRFTKALWQTYGAVDHSESWTTGSSYDNTHINVGDIAYIVGKVTDAGGSNDVYATIYGKVTSVTTAAVVMTSQYYIMGGEGGAYSLANTANTNAASAQSTANAAANAASDAQSTATNAAKTATNFLSYDATNGLQVGNKQSGSWVGYRAQIKPAAYNIVDQNGNVLASFGANEISIGQNSNDAIIKFCNGLASMLYDADQNYTTLKGLKMKLFGTNYAALQSHLKEATGESYTNNAWISTSAFGTSADINISASRYLTDSDDQAVDSDVRESYIFVSSDGIAAESDDFIRLTAPTVTIEGDAGITGHYYDNLGQPIRNGLAAYTGGGDSGINPNTTLEEVILTSHSNAPQGLGTFYYIHTVFYNAKSTTANRAQIAFPYNNSTGAVYTRYYNGSWSSWRKPYYEEDFRKIEMYSSGSPYIDFHYGSTNRHDGVDYTQRIIASNGGLLLYGATDTFVLVASDRFRSGGNDVHYLGDASQKWKAVYAVNGTIQTSDRNQKKNIESIDDRYVALFDKLQPVTFEFNDTESDRVHIGFISQDVKAAMDELGLADLDFAGYCRDIKTETVQEIDMDSPALDDNGEPIIDEDGNPVYQTKYVEREVLDEDGNPEYVYSLRYSEFIALNSKVIQLNRQKIAQQQQEIDTLKAEVEELKRLVQGLVAQD